MQRVVPSFCVSRTFKETVLIYRTWHCASTNFHEKIIRKWLRCCFRNRFYLNIVFCTKTETIKTWQIINNKSVWLTKLSTEKIRSYLCYKISCLQLLAEGNLDIRFAKSFQDKLNMFSKQKKAKGIRVSRQALFSRQSECTKGWNIFSDSANQWLCIQTVLFLFMAVIDLIYRAWIMHSCRLILMIRVMCFNRYLL